MAETKAKINKEGETRDSEKRNNVVQVSKTKKPLFFYLNLAKRYIKQYNEVELSGLGMAIPTVVAISEIMKRNGIAIKKEIRTSTVSFKDFQTGSWIHKPKIQVTLEKPGKTELIIFTATLDKGAHNNNDDDDNNNDDGCKLID